MSLGGEIAKKVRLLSVFLSQTMPQQACGRLARERGGEMQACESAVCFAPQTAIAEQNIVMPPFGLRAERRVLAPDEQ
jgi:hypothetical protein